MNEHNVKTAVGVISIILTGTAILFATLKLLQTLEISQ